MKLPKQYAIVAGMLISLSAPMMALPTAAAGAAISSAASAVIAPSAASAANPRKQLCSERSEALQSAYSRRNVKGSRIAPGPSPDDKIIINPLPELPRTTMNKNGWGWVLTDAGNMMCQNSTGSANLLVRDGDKVYLSNPLSLIAVEGWLEGTVEGNVVTLHLPQYVQQRTVQTESRPVTYDDYIVALDYGEDEEGGWYFPCPDQEYRLIIQEDGSWVPEDDTVMLGHCLWVDPADYGIDEEPEWDWQAAGDVYLRLTEVKEKPVEVPAGVDFKPYNLIYNNTYVEAQVGFDDADVYFKGLCTFAPSLREAAVKGTLKEGEITIPSGQYFGIAEEYRDVIYFMAGKSALDTDDNGASFRYFTPGDTLTFTYDASEGLMTSTDDYCMSVTMAEPYYYDIVLDPVVREANPNLVVKSLLKPIFWDFYPQNDQYGLPNQVVFLIPEVSAEYIPLDTNNIFYQVFVNDELFEFQPDEYDCLTEPMTDVPFGYNDDWDFYGDGNYQYVFVAPFDVDSLAVRTLYRNLDGSVVYSPFLYFLGDDPTSAVTALTSPAAILSTEWYDLTGRRLTAPAPTGLSIRLDRLTDGTTRSRLLLPKR